VLSREFLSFAKCVEKGDAKVRTLLHKASLLPAETMEHIFSKYDQDGNGSLALQAYVSCCSGCLPCSTDLSACSCAERHAYLIRGRSLDFEETKQALQDLKMVADDNDVKLLFEELDADGSGESFIIVLLVGHHEVSRLSSSSRVMFD
jgi:hypothetical protein